MTTSGRTRRPMETMPTFPQRSLASIPTHPIDPAVNFLPNQNLAEDFGARTIALIDRETQKIDVTMYRVTDNAVCDALLRALARGVPVRLLAEPHEYRFDAEPAGR